jgi:hypothetical protein
MQKILGKCLGSGDRSAEAIGPSNVEAVSTILWPTTYTVSSHARTESALHYSFFWPTLRARLSQSRAAALRPYAPSACMHAFFGRLC